MYKRQYKNKLIRKPAGFDCFPSNQTVRPRAAVYTNKKLRFSEIPLYTNADITTTLGIIAGKYTLLISAYLDITSNRVVPQILEDAIAFAKEKKFSVILGMDSNSQSELYGHSTNKRGEDLEDFIFSNNLRVENTGKIPTFESHIGKTIIDVTYERFILTSSNYR